MARHPQASTVEGTVTVLMAEAGRALLVVHPPETLEVGTTSAEKKTEVHPDIDNIG